MAFPRMFRVRYKLTVTNIIIIIIMYRYGDSDAHMSTKPHQRQQLYDRLNDNADSHQSFPGRGLVGSSWELTTSQLQKSYQDETQVIVNMQKYESPVMSHRVVAE